jgi:hypothetical protein
MPQTFYDPDPYAELDNRADAGELSEEFRKPVRVRRSLGIGLQPRSRVREALR